PAAAARGHPAEIRRTARDVRDRDARAGLRGARGAGSRRVRARVRGSDGERERPARRDGLRVHPMDAAEGSAAGRGPRPDEVTPLAETAFEPHRDLPDLLAIV